MVATADSKALTVYERMPDGLSAVRELGTAIAKSGMFGCGSIEQGQVLALECLARRMPPLTLAERYHVVQGKLMMKYDAMLAEFRAKGGKHKIIARTEDRAEIELELDGNTHREALTWDEAQKEKWPFKGDGKTLKDNWATPRARRQMLWARVVSEGVRALCPEVNNGRYVAEEIEDDGQPAASSNGRAESRATTSVVDQAEAAAKTGATDAEFEVKQGQSAAATAAAASATPPAAATSPAQPSGQFATDAQVKKLGILAVALQCGDKLQAAYAKRGVASARSLQAADAQAIIDKLEAELNQRQAADQAAEHPADQPAAAMPPCGPATEEQVARVKQALAEFCQHDPKGYGEMMTNIKTWLAQNGKAKFADMDATQIAQLYDSVCSKSLPTFIRMDLEKHAAKDNDEADDDEAAGAVAKN